MYVLEEAQVREVPEEVLDDVLEDVLEEVQVSKEVDLREGKERTHG